jgi:hypothetical protein
MTHAFSTSSSSRYGAWLRNHLAIALYALVVSIALGAVAPAKSRAAMPDADIFFDYGFKGLTIGAELGLSVGYLSAGSRFEEQEWRKLVLGVGIGALAGLASGIVIAIADVSSGSVPVGYYILRAASYGVWIGAAIGTIVGALLWIDDGRPRDLLQGAAYGSLFGAVAGMAFGIIEGKNTAHPSRRYYDDDWRYSFAPVPGGGLAGVVAKRF